MGVAVVRVFKALSGPFRVLRGSLLLKAKMLTPTDATAVGLRCARFHSLKYDYQTLADFASIQSIRQQYPPRILLTAVVTSSPASPILQPPDNAAGTISSPLSLTTVDAPCNPSSLVESTMNLPIAERTWGKPTAWSAKIGEVAISGGNAESFKVEFAKERFIKLLYRLIAIAAFMFVL